MIFLPGRSGLGALWAESRRIRDKTMNGIFPTLEEFEFAALEKAVNYRRGIAREFRNILRGRVLEVGAGVGQFTGEILRHPGVERLTALEPEERFLRRIPEDPRLEAVAGTTGTLDRPGYYDSLVSVNVLEHIGDDREELGRCSRLLKPGGRLGLLVPARPEIYAPIDRSFGHHRRYTRAGLREKLETAGFCVDRLHYFNLPGYFAWWLNFKCRGVRTFDAGMVSWYDRIVVPVALAVEQSGLRPPLGQSLVVLATRPAV